MKELYDLKYGVAQAREVPDEYKQKAVDWLQINPSDRVLELGVGSADFLRTIQILTPYVWGLDINSQLLRHLGYRNTFAADARKLPLRSYSIDKSLSSHTLEHILDLGSVFQELDRVTKPGGLSFHVFPAPSARTIRGLDGSLFDAWNVTHNPITAFLLARKYHPHNLNLENLENFIEKTNWRLEEHERIYIPIEKGWAWTVLLKKY